MLHGISAPDVFASARRPRESGDPATLLWLWEAEERKSLGSRLRGNDDLVSMVFMEAF
jgi:hypothetical protein